MKRRWITGLLAGLLLVQTTACGQAGEAVDQTTESVQEQTAETENQTETTDEAASALSLMQQVNRGEENIIDDNYRNYYEVFVYSFYDSDGDGIGDLNGLTEKLDYINDGDPETDTDLGCNGIWLMPVMPSTTYHKYDVTGSLCENNDKFAIDRYLPKVDMGDLLVIHDTGAHGFAMGYNYNGKLKSSEILLHEDGSFEMIRRAETPKDYFATFDCFPIYEKLLEDMERISVWELWLAVATMEEMELQ